MKILHYSLGFPPYRSGGLTKFCMDLMFQQTVENNDVALLWPGRYNFLCNKMYIKKNKNYKNIKNFELINPLPVPYDEGIKEIQEFTKKINGNLIGCFLGEFHPDIIHIHTFMGLPKEFLIEAKKYNIKIIYTTHDFFPICPKVTMFREGKVCDCVKNFKYCAECNKTALSINKIKILQSSLYRNIKDCKIVKKIRMIHRESYFKKIEGDISINEKVNLFSEDYKKLRDYYTSMIELVDVIHANSYNTKKIYENNFVMKKIKVIPISHSNIVNEKKIKNYDSKTLNLTYLGQASGAKGYFILKEALDKLWNVNRNFVLNIYFNPKDKSDYMKIHDRYDYTELEKIFNYTDLLIAPSICFETFGFTVLEALSFGVPVLVSGNVGSKDIIPKDCGIIIENISSDKILNCLKNLKKQDLAYMNRQIILNVPINTMELVSEKIYKECYL